MKKTDFYRGMKIRWKDDSGVVNFIGSQYITITTREWPDPDKSHGVSQCNLLCPSCYWDEIEVMEEQPSDN